MGGSKEIKLNLDTYGNYLGMEKGCIILKDRKGEKTRYPLTEDLVGEVVLNSGNMVSSGLLCSLGFWGIDLLIATRNGRPVAMLRNLDDDSHVSTRIAQYEALKNGKGCYLAKQFVLGKIEGQRSVLEKYRLKTDYSLSHIVAEVKEPSLARLRMKLLGLEGKYGRYYFTQVFQLFPEEIRPLYRSTFGAYDGVNNIFNLAYRILFWKCYRGLTKAHLEPYLGFLHRVEFGRPSLVCDFVELYRHLIDGYLIEYCRKLEPKDFHAKAEERNNKRGKRVYLSDSLTQDLVKRLFEYFQTKFEIPRIRRGRRQELETLINEEAFLMGRYLRLKNVNWSPRIAVP